MKLTTTLIVLTLLMRANAFLNVIDDFINNADTKMKRMLENFLENGNSRVLLPDINYSVPEMIEYNGYPSETHHVVTKDGYILEVHRIAGNRNKTLSKGIPVFLQHGLLCSSSNWVENMPDKSLGFILADRGYDVWLGNVRGNSYSRNHTHLSPDSQEFWDFSWQDMAEYDVPAMLEYVLNVTGYSSLYYAGHSQGTLITFASFSKNKELAAKVKLFFAMGPVSTLRYMSSSMVTFLAKIKDIITSLFGQKEFMPRSEMVRSLSRTVCRSAIKDVCSNIIFAFGGYNDANLNKTRMPVYLQHTPAGTSVRNVLHFIQMMEHGQMEGYNFRSISKNLKHYNSLYPPSYNMREMETPVVVIYGGQDPLADERDVLQLIPKLPNVKDILYDYNWSHMDFIWGMDVAERIYKPIGDMIEANEEQLKKFS